MLDCLDVRFGRALGARRPLGLESRLVANFEGSPARTILRSWTPDHRDDFVIVQAAIAITASQRAACEKRARVLTAVSGASRRRQGLVPYDARDPEYYVARIGAPRRRSVSFLTTP
jgi:hypothetical protein